MALGRFTLRGTISSNTDTSIAPAPGVNQRIYVTHLTITVSVAGTSSRAVVTDGVSGGVLERMATTTADAILNVNYSTGQRSDPGVQLSENTALVITTSGTGAATINYEVRYEVKGTQLA